MNSKRAKQLRRLTACGIDKTYNEVKRMYKDKTLNEYLKVESDNRKIKGSFYATPASVEGDGSTFTFNQ